MAVLYKVVMGPAPYVSNFDFSKWLIGPTVEDISFNIEKILLDHASQGWELDRIIEYDATVSLFWFLSRTYTYRLMVFKKTN